MATWGLSPLAQSMFLGFDVEKVQGPWDAAKKKYKILAAKVSVVEIILDSKGHPIPQTDSPSSNSSHGDGRNGQGSSNNNSFQNPRISNSDQNPFPASEWNSPADAKFDVSNYPGLRVVFDTLVYQKEEDITNYNNWITGLNYGDLEKGMRVAEVKQRLSDIFRMRTIIVMDGDRDFESVGLNHKDFDVVDLKIKLIRSNNSPIKLSKLVKHFYNHDIHDNDAIHDPSIDAYWTLKLYHDHVAVRNEEPLKIDNI